MLLGKLKNPVVKIYQTDGLNTTTVTAEYLAANVENYVLGELKTSFYYKIGKVEFDDEGNVIKFNPVIRGNIQVSSEDLENWGVDDSVALIAVAKALNVEVVEFIDYKGGIFKS